MVLAVLTSCVDDSKLLFDVDKPGTMAELEYLRGYDVLKTYIDRSANPEFKLGAGVSVNAFNKKAGEYSMIVSNFDEVVAGWEMKHGAVVQGDGSLNLGNVVSFIETAKAANIAIYGHTLCWHANQNAKYLNKTIAPTIIPGQPAWEVLTSADFETDDESNYTSNANAVRSFVSPGKDGRALKITNAVVRTNDWDSQFFVTLPTKTALGERYTLTMDVRADNAATYPTQAHVEPYVYKHWDFFGQISATTAWTTYVKEITITAETEGVGAIAFNLGATATAYYFDNIKVEKYNENAGGGPSLDPSVITTSDFESGGGGWMGWGNGSTRRALGARRGC